MFIDSIHYCEIGENHVKKSSEIVNNPPPPRTQIPCTDVTDTIMVHSPPRANREVRMTVFSRRRTADVTSRLALTSTLTPHDLSITMIVSVDNSTLVNP